MRVLIQRVSEAAVKIDGETYSTINKGILLLVGIEEKDNQTDIDWLVSKITNLRIFPDSDNKMNLSLIDINGEVLVVSQFTLHASTKKGTRTSFIKAAKPDSAIPLYETFIKTLNSTIKTTVKTGVFGADMKVSLINDGPVTIWLDSKNKS